MDRPPVDFHGAGFTRLPSQLRNETRIALARAVLRPAFGLLTRTEVHGLTHVPREGGCVLVFNHLSNLDPHLLFCVIARARATGLVAAEYQRRSLHRLMVELCGGVWLRRGQGDRRALELALSLLAAGWLVGLAPEGRRSPGGALLPGRPGAAFLAMRSGLPILPVALTGTELIGSSLRRLRRAAIVIRFGEPFTLPCAHGLPRRERLREQTSAIMARIAALLPPDYRGVYAASPVRPTVT